MVRTIKSENAVPKNGNVLTRIRDIKTFILPMRASSSAAVGRRDLAIIAEEGRHESAFLSDKFSRLILLSTAQHSYSSNVMIVLCGPASCI